MPINPNTTRKTLSEISQDPLKGTRFSGTYLADIAEDPYGTVIEPMENKVLSSDIFNTADQNILDQSDVQIFPSQPSAAREELNRRNSSKSYWEYISETPAGMDSTSDKVDLMPSVADSVDPAIPVSDYYGSDSGKDMVDNGTNDAAHLSSPWITAQQLQRQAETMGNDDIIDWMKENNVWSSNNSSRYDKDRDGKDDDDGIPDAPNLIFNKSELRDRIGYDDSTPNSKALGPFDFAKIGADLSNLNAGAAHNVAKARTALTGDDWDVHHGGTDISGQSVDKAAREFIDNIFKNIDDYSYPVIKDVNGDEIPIEDAKSIYDQLRDVNNEDEDSKWFMAIKPGDDQNVYIWSPENPFAPGVEAKYVIPQSSIPGLTEDGPDQFEMRFFPGVLDDTTTLVQDKYGNAVSISGREMFDMTKKPDIIKDLTRIDTSREVSDSEVDDAVSNSGKETDYLLGFRKPTYVDHDITDVANIPGTALDVILQSAPYMVPGWQQANSVLQTNLASQGINPMSGREIGGVMSYTPVDNSVTAAGATGVANAAESLLGSAAAGGLASGLVKNGKGLFENILAKPYEKLAQAVNKGRLDSAISKTDDPDVIADIIESLARTDRNGNIVEYNKGINPYIDEVYDALSSWSSEGFEEVATNGLWQVAESGDIADFFAPDVDDKYDEYGSHVLNRDASAKERLKEYVDSGNMLNDFGLGALVGAAMDIPIRGINHIMRNGR